MIIIHQAAPHVNPIVAAVTDANWGPAIVAVTCCLLAFGCMLCYIIGYLDDNTYDHNGYDTRD